MNKLIRVTGHLISSLSFQPIQSHVLQILWASLYVKDKLCLIPSQAQGHSTPGGRCTQANMCKYKEKTLSDSFWVLLNTAWPTQPHQCGAAGTRAETVCLWGQYRKQKIWNIKRKAVFFTCFLWLIPLSAGRRVVNLWCVVILKV